MYEPTTGTILRKNNGKEGRKQTNFNWKRPENAFVTVDKKRRKIRSKAQEWEKSEQKNQQTVNERQGTLRRENKCEGSFGI